MITLPEANIAPTLKMVVSNRNLLFQGSIFRCYVSFREGTSYINIQTIQTVLTDLEASAVRLSSLPAVA